MLILFSCTNVYAVSQSQRNAILDTHNMIRTEHNLPKLVWDTKIEKQAQAWANAMMKHNTVAHSPVSSRKWMGENIYTIITTDSRLASDGSDAVMLWYAESSRYDYERNTCASGSVCGHFTQLIWKTTKRIGCGQSIRKKWDTTTIYWVCQYDPAGNVVWQNPY